MKGGFLKGCAVGSACAAAVLFTASALAGSGVGGIFNLGQTNTVDQTSTLTGAAIDYELRVFNTVAGQTALRADGAGAGYGVVGVAPDGVGVVGRHSATTGLSAGVEGDTKSTDDKAAGVVGKALTTQCCYQTGVLGQASGAGAVGLHGEAGTSGKGVWAEGGSGYGGWLEASSAGGYGIEAVGGSGGKGGVFIGDVYVAGTLSANTKTFKIDDPLDPAHKYLVHTSVESPDMKTVYDGIVTTDRRGVATVRLPRYFQALNRTFRYQLTTIGRDADAWVAREIAHNRFVIRTDHPSVKVSWQVTGIRHDRWANANRAPVEQEKSPAEQGRYVSPEVYGKPVALRLPVKPHGRG